MSGQCEACFWEQEAQAQEAEQQSWHGGWQRVERQERVRECAILDVLRDISEEHYGERPLPGVLCERHAREEREQEERVQREVALLQQAQEAGKTTVRVREQLWVVEDGGPESGPMMRHAWERVEVMV